MKNQGIMREQILAVPKLKIIETELVIKLNGCFKPETLTKALKRDILASFCSKVKLDKHSAGVFYWLERALLGVERTNICRQRATPN